MTKSFLRPLDLRYLDGRNWEVLRPFTYRLAAGTCLDCGPDERCVCGPLEITVPAGFETDFASVPRFLWRILPPTGRYGKAAVVHDYLYRNGPWSRRTADAVFLEGMQALGVGWWTRRAMWLGVRLFGRRAYAAGHGEN